MRRAARVAFLLGLGASCLIADAAEIGQVVPEFEGQTLDGQLVSLSEALHTHRAVVVVFLSTLCPYARFFGTHLQDLSHKFGGQGLLVVGVDSNKLETVDEIAADARRRGYDFPMVKDEDARIADALGAQVTPESFLIDETGRLRYRGRVKSKQGATDLQDALLAVLAGRDVRTPVTKAFGCAIQRH